MKTKQQIDWFFYAKFVGGISMISPLVFAFWRLDFSTSTALIITSSTYAVIIPLGILMLNYLEGGSCFTSVKKYQGNKY